MDIDRLKSKLMDYLYDELSTEKRIEFEKELESNPELIKEFEELRKVRAGLSLLEDKEVMEPFFLWGKNRSQIWNNIFTRKNLIMFRPFIAVAASLVLVLLVGYFTNFTLSYKNDTFYMGFNKQTTQPSRELSREEILNLVKNEIAMNNSVIMNRLEKSEDDVESRLASLEKRKQPQPVIRQAANVVTEKELQQYYRQFQAANSALIENFLQTSSEQQQEYFQAVLTQFSSYLQEQRVEDLRLIKRSLVDLKEDQDQQILETQQILTTLINNSNINNQSN
jgi:hypothetical protein